MAPTSSRSDGGCWTAMCCAPIHVFDARDAAFRDGAVLQETIVFRIERGGEHSTVQIAASSGTGLDMPRRHRVSAASVVHPDDADRFIRIPEDRSSVVLAERMGALPASMRELAVTVSTGRVVDFRSRDFLRSECTPQDVPLIYPAHMRRGRIEWPNGSSDKPSAIASDHQTRGMFLPAGDYVLVRRFSAKEERRRVVAAVLERDDLPGRWSLWRTTSMCCTVLTPAWSRTWHGGWRPT